MSSQRDPDHGEHISGAGHMGVAAPMLVDGGGDLGFGPRPDTVLETFEALGLGKQLTLTGGGPPAPPATSVQAELPGGLLIALKSASIVDEHRALMGAVIEKI